MTHHAPIAPGEPLGFAHDSNPHVRPESRPQNRPTDRSGDRPGERWSHPKMAQFLRQLSATHSVSAAARSVGMSRQAAYRLRSRLKGGAFDLAWDVAFQHSYDNLAHAALERALNGVEVPVYFQGEQVGSYRRFDERLTVALLAKSTQRGNVPRLGRHAGEAELHAGRFDALLAEVEAGMGEARAPAGDPGEDPGPAPVGEIMRLDSVNLSPGDTDEIYATIREIYGDPEEGDRV